MDIDLACGVEYSGNFGTVSKKGSHASQFRLCSSILLQFWIHPLMTDLIWLQIQEYQDQL